MDISGVNSDALLDARQQRRLLCSLRSRLEKLVKAKKEDEYLETVQDMLSVVPPCDLQMRYQHINAAQLIHDNCTASLFIIENSFN